MTLRSRPVLDRKHRPRWQDELRTQQLTVTSFAVAIALAVGIFGATSWIGYWDAHLRPVASVAGTIFTRSDLAARERVTAAELAARAAELQSQMGGPRDAIIQQELDGINQQLSSLAGSATDSLVNGALLGARAGELGVSVTDEEIDADIANRRGLPERARLQMILVAALPAEAEAGTEPTDEQRAAARQEAEAVLQRLREGEDFATVAQEVSDDFTAQLGGELGWVEDGDPVSDEHFDATRDAEVGDLVGPLETDRGAVVLKLVDRRPAAEDETLVGLLDQSGTGEAAYRAHVRDTLLVEAFRGHFEEKVAVSPQPQRRVAQIYVAPLTGTPLPEERARHVLVQPLPDAPDQTAATEEQWAAALAEAQEVRALLVAEGADWFAVAEEHSDDPGSAARGGDLGWFDPAAPGFVAEFADVLANLEVGDVSEPLRTEFGYHVIQKTGERTSPQAMAAELVTQLREDADSFAEVATRLSEDHETARAGGELGWVAPYQLPQHQEEAIFALQEVGDISDAVDLASEGIYIFKLLEVSDEREVEETRLEQIRASGFDRWLEQEVKSGVPVWIDPEFASSTAA